MVSKTVTVLNDEGLHMRPAGALAKAASEKKDCEITIKYNGKTANAKSVMSIMLADINCGEQIELVCSGANEQQVLDELVEKFENRFE